MQTIETSDSFWNSMGIVCDTDNKSSWQDLVELKESLMDFISWLRLLLEFNENILPIKMLALTW